MDNNLDFDLTPAIHIKSLGKVFNESSNGKSDSETVAIYAYSGLTKISYLIIKI